MYSSEKENSDNRKCEKIKAKGKGKYLLGQSRLWIITGIGFGVIFHISESGFDLLNLDFARRLFIGGTFFLIGGYLQALSTWKKLEKKHS